VYEDRPAVFKQIFLFEAAQYRTLKLPVDIQPKLTGSIDYPVISFAAIPSIDRLVPSVFVTSVLPFLFPRDFLTDSYKLFDTNVMR
jgi:hypothetical protein